jgi:hypothetical protein
MLPFVINLLGSNSASVFDSERSHESHCMVGIPLYIQELLGLTS